MSLKLVIALLCAVLLGAPVGYVLYEGKRDNWGHEHPTHWKDGGGVHGVPGPLAGAGLPILAVGFGVYWLVRRRRKAN
jgi:hypothetical protein